MKTYQSQIPGRGNNIPASHLAKFSLRQKRPEAAKTEAIDKFLEEL